MAAFFILSTSFGSVGFGILPLTIFSAALILLEVETTSSESFNSAGFMFLWDCSNYYSGVKSPLAIFGTPRDPQIGSDWIIVTPSGTGACGDSIEFLILKILSKVWPSFPKSR